MARKDEHDGSSEHGFNDVVGLVLLCGSLLMLVSLFSYDRNDLHFNKVPANEFSHNWIGPIGANLAFGLLFFLGGGAFLLPVLCLGLGLSSWVSALAYLRRRWPWLVVFLCTCTCVLDLASARFSGIPAILDSGSAGGFSGYALNRFVFSHFGTVGSSILFATLYGVSLLFLTNFQVSEWVRKLRMPKMGETPFGGAGSGKVEKKEKATAGSEREEVLEKRAKELAKEAKRLEEEVAKTGLGADLKPVPEPTVRDLSITQPRPDAEAPKGKGKAGAASGGEVPREPKVFIAGSNESPFAVRDVPTATTAAVLGRPEPAKPLEVSVSEAAVEPVVAADEDEEVGAKLKMPPPFPRARNAAVRKSKPITVASTPVIGNYKLPGIQMLNYPEPNLKPTESKEELMSNARLMQSTLAQFDIEVALGDITKGPTITRYELHPAPGVRLEKIVALSNNIAAALKAERINILAPVPGKSSVGVEVPNLVKTKVIMRDLLESDEWNNSKARIPLALGKDVYGLPIIADLAEMPHLLIAGSTGSGKSVCINSIIASLLVRFSPDQLRFVMIDPKVVELQQYNGLPHLVVPVVNDPKKVILALRWVVNEMEKRYQIFAKVGVRNIKSFNDRPKDKPVPKAEPELPLKVQKEKIEAGSEGFAVELDEEIVVPREDDIVIPEKLSYIVVIIDELADLMLVAPADVEMAIARITQMARAAGIHCIVATQRPSVDVITGVIKANIPARIAFQVAAKVDSRTILDAMGADKLLGKGDMLYLPPGSAKLIRAQGVLITDQEIQQIVDFIKGQGKPSYEMEIHQQLQKPAASMDSDGEGSDEDEDLIEQCIEVIRSEQKASVSLMQRRLRLGYTRAARIMDELESRGIVGPSKGAEPRDILIDLDGGGADGRGV